MNADFPHKCLSVLGNKVRVEIIQLLQQKPRTVKEMCTALGKEQSLISHALQQLRECNYIDYKPNGKEREYFLKSDIFTKKSNKPIFELIEEHVQKYCM